MSNIIQLTAVDREARASTVQIAEQLGVDHRHAYRMVRDFLQDFQELGLVCFENTAVKSHGARGTKRRKFALLNEDQCYLLLSYSRNTKRVRGLKLALVKAFGQARHAGIAKSLTAWQQLQALQIEDAGSFARASVGSRLMLERKHDLPRYRARRELLEREVAPQLFQLTH